MVKPDVKVNYYAALELPPDASIDDCKKSYRKLGEQSVVMLCAACTRLQPLALKWHPDRNRGNEEEAAYKFQAIAAAHEILSDEGTKSRYDSERRRAGLSGNTPRSTTSAWRPSAHTSQPSAFAPPPRRTYDPTGWTKASGARTNPSTSNGADRFTNFPRPSTTPRQNQSEGEKKSAAEAWNYMNASGAAKPSQPAPGAAKSAQPASSSSSQWGASAGPSGKPAQANSNAQRRPVPPIPVPSRDSQPQSHAQTRHAPHLPRREIPKTSRDHNPFVPERTSTTERTAYAHFNPQPSPATQQRPSFHRSSTTSGQLPRRPTGYDPSSNDDERAAPTAPLGYTTAQVKDPEFRPPSQSFTPNSPKFAPHTAHESARRASAHTNLSPLAAPFETARNIPADSQAQMRRSQSVKDATNLGSTPTSQSSRSSRQRSTNSAPYADTRPKSAGATSFSIRDDSDDSTSESTSSMPQPFFDRTRPVRKATGARSRTSAQSTSTERVQSSTNSMPHGSYPDHSSHKSTFDEQNQAPAQPKNPMYGENFSPFDADFSDTRSSCDIPSTAAFDKTVPAVKRGVIPQWAIPPSVQFRSAGKQNMPEDPEDPEDIEDTSEQPIWEYTEDSLIDIDDDAANAHANSHPSCTMPCDGEAQRSHQDDLRELFSQEHPGFVTCTPHFFSNSPAC